MPEIRLFVWFVRDSGQFYAAVDKNDTTQSVGITVSAVVGIWVSWLTCGLFCQDIPFSPAVAGILM